MSWEKWAGHSWKPETINRKQNKGGYLYDSKGVYRANRESETS